MNQTDGEAPAIEFRKAGYRLANGRELLHNPYLEVKRGETLVLLASAITHL